MTDRGQEDAGALDALQARLGHFFKNPGLLRQALTHPSAAAEDGASRLLSYERLEFLGDALLNFYVGELLFDRFPREDEGVLTRLRAYWVSQPRLADSARGLGVGGCIRLGAGELRGGGASKERILASALEALFGALYLDAGGRACKRLARNLWAEEVRKRGLSVLAEDAKTSLQELRQGSRLSLPEYRTAPSGEGFACTVLLDGSPAGTGSGPTRKAAEQAAARAALEGAPAETRGHGDG